MKKKNRYQYFGLIIPLVVIGLFFYPTISKLFRAKNFCQVQGEILFSRSVQPNESIHRSLFREKNCSPHKMVLRLPVNAIIQNPGTTISLQQYTPKISTIVTFSNSNKPEFYIRRIDQYEDGFYFTNSDSCFAAKWSKHQDEAILHISLERNLLIDNSDIKSMTFLISIPPQNIETITKIIIDKYTWDRVGRRFTIQAH